MSGIVGSYFNTRGSGVVAKLGTDGQVFTSTGAGLSQGFEAAAGGGKLLQAGEDRVTAQVSLTSTSDAEIDPLLVQSLTPATTDSKILVHYQGIWGWSGTGIELYIVLYRQINGGGYAIINGSGTFIVNRTQYCEMTMHYLDSPSTTTQVDYKAYYKVSSGTAYHMYYHSEGAGRMGSSITLMEIGG